MIFQREYFYVHFLGTVNYLTKFLLQLSELSEAVSQLNKRNVEWGVGWTLMQRNKVKRQ